jgi:hypothetical protein
MMLTNLGSPRLALESRLQIIKVKRIELYSVCLCCINGTVSSGIVGAVRARWYWLYKQHLLHSHLKAFVELSSSFVFVGKLC